MADASSAIEAEINNTKKVTSGHPIPIIIGPPAWRPVPYNVTAPVKMEITEKEIAKLEKPPMSRKSC